MTWSFCNRKRVCTEQSLECLTSDPAFSSWLSQKRQALHLRKQQEALRSTRWCICGFFTLLLLLALPLFGKPGRLKAFDHTSVQHVASLHSLQARTIYCIVGPVCQVMPDAWSALTSCQEYTSSSMFSHRSLGSPTKLALYIASMCKTFSWPACHRKQRANKMAVLPKFIDELSEKWCCYAFAI